ncbi:MAG: DUF2786 domain-containing protein [Polyangiaceae bacterium]|nr:DUF2786 domain-containing protein [Polyangiaceae bacterium]
MPGLGAPPSELSTELEAAALRALRGAYSDLNLQIFGGRLQRPVLALGSNPGRLGAWLRAHRTIELGRSLLAEQGWGTVLEVLKHEMAHQFVDEVLGHQDETAHGPAFREVCRTRGIDQRATGLPASATTDSDHRALERIAKLLALAASPNEHEAQAAALAAQRLMLKYNIEIESQGAARRYGFRHLGKPTGRVSEAERILAAILSEHFFVEAIWVPIWRALEGKRGSVLEVCGTPQNLELAEYAYSFLLHTAGALWRANQRARHTKLNGGRRQFLAGVMTGFSDRLARQKQAHQKEGLVWVGDAELGSFFRQRHPRVRWTRHFGSRHTDAFASGREEGQKIVIHRGFASGATTACPALPPRRS